jgi:D-lactate dehydrogenase
VRHSSTAAAAMPNAGICFFDSRPYWTPYFDAEAKSVLGTEIKYVSAKLDNNTAVLATGCKVAVAFVNCNVDSITLENLHSLGVKMVALRGAGYNHVDLM